MLLKQVKTWIDIAGIDYARKTLSETGVADPHIAATGRGDTPSYPKRSAEHYCRRVLNRDPG